MAILNLLDVCLVRGRVVIVVGTAVSVLVLLARLEPLGIVLPASTVKFRPTTSPGPASCSHMFTVDKGRPGVVWDSENPYEKLSRQLQPLLENLEGGNIDTARILPGTRLEYMKSVIPYLPCKVRTFGTAEVDRCVAARAHHGTNTWIAFVGDSTQRQKLHTFMSFLPPGLDYTYYLGSTEVSLKEFVHAVTYHIQRPPTFDIIGRQRRLSHTTTTSSSQVVSSGLPDISDSSGSANDNPHQLNDPYKSDTILMTSRVTEIHVTDDGNDGVNDVNDDNDGDNDDVDEDDDSDKQESPEKENPNPFFEVLNPDPTFWSTSHAHDNYDPLWEGGVGPAPYDLRVTVVWTTGPREGEGSGDATTNRTDVAKLEEWLQGPSLPQVVVVGFGTWMLLYREHGDELAPFTVLEETVRPLLPSLTRLAASTRVLYWAQSRFRWFNYDGEGVVSLKRQTKTRFWEQMLYLNQFNDSIPFVDGRVWELIRGTGAWHWDSTLPFNLANLRECQMLTQARLFSHPLFTGRWWNCNDVHHSSYKTNSVELQMLLNLLCNKYTDTSQEYCCSENVL